MLKYLNSWSVECDQDRDANDCVPFAIHKTCDSSYAKAHALCAGLGRIAGKGCNAHAILDGQKDFNGWNFRELPLARVMFFTYGPRMMTLHKFVKANPVGRFLVRTKGHLIAVVDGVVIDFRLGQRRKINFVFEVTKH